MDKRIKKVEYQKPTLICGGNFDGVIPAGLPAAIAAFTTGVVAGVGVKKMLSGSKSFNKIESLTEIGGLG